VSQLSPDRFDSKIVGRSASHFADDMQASQTKIADALQGRRILVVGGGGSIGSSTTRLLLRYSPAAVHVIDHSENYLAELVRDIRSSTDLSSTIDLRMLPIDFGGAIARKLIASEAPYDIVMNFAALKHVRSEKDVYSLMQMLDTNVVRQARFKEVVAERGGTTRFFGVSTDKAANPTSLMGATKRLMEDVLFTVATDGGMTVTSARFANVLFSNGSLPQSWLRRLELGQPLVAPRDTRRYFVTRAESGEICLLASLLGSDGEIFIPRLDPQNELRLLEETARQVLAELDLEPVIFADEAEARQAVERLRSSGRWPLLLTPLDTSGEKPYEEFVGRGEVAHEIGLKGLQAVQHVSSRLDGAFIDRLETLIRSQNTEISKVDIVQTLSEAVLNLQHRETDRNLDQRM
jgi:FlaA1/EpsC-like NDP-sugar epimerase